MQDVNHQYHVNSQRHGWGFDGTGNMVEHQYTPEDFIHECPFCAGVYDDYDLTETANRCPHCGEQV